MQSTSVTMTQITHDLRIMAQLTVWLNAASFNDKRVGAVPPLQFYPTNPLCLSDGNTTDRELTGDRDVGIHCGQQLTASAGDDTAVREPCSLRRS